MATNFGVMMVFKEHLEEETKKWWRFMEATYGSVAVQAFPYPNVLLYAGVAKEMGSVKNVLERIAVETAPLTIEVDGFGMRKVPKPLVYMNIEQSDGLRFLREQMVEGLKMHSLEDPNPLYTMDWLPLVPIAYGDVANEALTAFAGAHLHEDFQYDERVHELTLVEFDLNGNCGVVQTFPFSQHMYKTFR